MTTREQGLDMEALEGMVDRHGLSGVLDMLVDVCGEKAEHLRANWGDEYGAQTWERMAKALEKATLAVAKA